MLVVSMGRSSSVDEIDSAREGGRYERIVKEVGRDGVWWNELRRQGSGKIRWNCWGEWALNEWIHGSRWMEVMDGVDRRGRWMEVDPLK